MAQVKVIFELPQALIDMLQTPPIAKHFVYVEWFTDFTLSPEPNSKLYKIKHSLQNGMRRASIIPIDHIHRSIHLIPKFGSQVPSTWTCENVLELCGTFYVNSFSDRHAYHTII